VQVDKQLSLDHVEKLVVIVVLVTVILALNYAPANHRFVHLAKRLVMSLKLYPTLLVPACINWRIGPLANARGSERDSGP
jgi:hypothetical protein